MKFPSQLCRLSSAPHDGFAVMSALLIAFGSFGYAANSWDGGGGNGNWSTAANWDNNAVPANSSSLTFAGTSQLNAVNDTGTITTFVGLTFAQDAGAFTLSGNALTMGGNITNNSANVQTIGMNLTLANIRTIQGGAGVTLSGTLTNSGGNRELINNLTSGTLTLGAINLSENATSRGITLTSNGTTVVNGVIANGGGSAAGSVIKSGTGSLSLTRANTYAGATTVNGGTLKLDFAAAGAPVSDILYNGVAAAGLSMVASGSNVGSPVSLVLTGQSGTANTQTLASLNLGQSSATRGTAAQLILQGGASGSVGLTISNASNPLVLYGGSTLNISLGTSDTVTITNGGTTSAGLVGVGANVGTSTLVTLNSSDWASLNGSKQIVAASYTNSFATTSNTNLDVLASGTLTGTAVNTLRLNQAAPTTVTVNSASTSINGILVTSAVGNNDVTIAGQAIRGANNQTLAVFQYNTAGDLIINSSIASQGTSGLVKAGGGRVVLTAANTYTGRTFVNEGTLLLDGGSISTGVVTVATNARLGGVGSVAGETFVSVGGVIQAGDGEVASGNLTFSNNLTFADGTRIELTLGAAGAHSSLVRAGGIWAFDSNQAFTLIFNGAAAGVYDNIISGLTGSESGLATIGTWTITNDGAVGTFSYDGSGGVDLTMSTIPEPSTWALLGLALAGLAGFGRKFRKRCC